MEPGVYLVGAGPGDPGLLTVKGRGLLAAADVVIHDSLVSEAVLKLARPEAELICAGKRAGEPCRPQSEIDELLVARGRAGGVVVRLKGGDPCIFGRGGEEAAALREAHVRFEIVPGVTAALGAAAYAGIPLTHRSHSSVVIFLTGHEDPAKLDAAVQWEAYGRLEATLCIYMVLRNLDSICRRLEAGGLDPATPAALIQSGTSANQRVLRTTVSRLAGDAAAEGFGSPAIAIIGRVADLAEVLAWKVGEVFPEPVGKRAKGWMPPP